MVRIVRSSVCVKMRQIVTTLLDSAVAHLVGLENTAILVMIIIFTQIVPKQATLYFISFVCRYLQ